ncbi:MAG: DUF4834 family protein [Chitinophagales bacterium]|nr:DUF4834 family protein [Chitinophagales bacterium]
MPLLDAIIIGLMVYALFFSGRKKKTAPPQNDAPPKTTINQNGTAPNSHFKKDDGKYIDYEEIK